MGAAPRIATAASAKAGFVRSVAVLAGCIVVAACGKGDAPAVDIDVIGAETAPFETGPRLPVAAQLVRSATAEGLVALDGKGQVIPGLADRWIVTDDGLSYIFRLRDGGWSDGTAISGETAKAALDKALESLKNTPLSQEFAAIDEIRAMTGRVIEIRLTHPAPDLLQLLAQPELGLFHKARGSGPMSLSRQASLAVLTPIPPDRLGLPRPENWADEAQAIRLRAMPADRAAQRFADGKVNVVLGGRFETYPQALGSAGLSRRALKLDPVSGLFGLVVVRPTGPLGNPALREALAMAIDRDALASTLAISGWSGASRIVPNSSDKTVNADRWAGLSLAQRQAEAAGRIARWRGRKAVPALRIALPAGPGADQLFARLEADLATIGMPLARVGPNGAADLQLVDIVARVNQPEWYLGQLSCAARRGLCSDLADARLAVARSTDDMQKRAALLAEAEQILTAANVYIPLGGPVRWSLVRDSVTGFTLNSAGFHPLPDFALPQR
jgi:peptide/nickel transport system substrate-binding protein/oligopeptide transport system substrate-binding protein